MRVFLFQSLKEFHISYPMFATRRAADRFRVYGKRILAYSRISTNANTTIPQSYLPSSSGLQINHYANTVDGGICLTGFRCKGLRQFSGVSHNEDAEEVKNDEEESIECHKEEDENDDVKENYFSPNETPLWKVLFSPFTKERNTNEVLEEWVKQGNAATQQDFFNVMRGFRKRKLFKRALEVSSWVSTKTPFEFDEDYYATHFDCILRCQGFFAAEKYLSTIPPGMKGIKVYRVLLKNCVFRRNVRKAEFAFKKMKGLQTELPMEDYNTMLHIYCQFERKKIETFLQSMQNENVKPNSATYGNLIFAKGLVHEVDGMIELLEKMKAEGLEPDIDTLAFLAKHCIKSKMEGKAEEMLNELEKQSKLDQVTLLRKKFIRRMLFQSYALLKKEKDVERLWNEIESDVDISPVDYLVGIYAWGQLGNTEKAEKIFESLAESRHSVISKHYNGLLQVYATHGLHSKAEELLEKMLKSGIKWNRDHRGTIVRLYANMGDLQKAESMLCDNDDRMFTAKYDVYLLVLKAYAEQGDIEGAERIFSSMKQAGYRRRFAVYVNLLQGYINAKVAPTGIEERVKADKCLFDKNLQELLQQANQFQKEPAP